MWINNIIEKLSEPDIKKQFDNNQIEHLWLFGSFAKWNYDHTSDIDLLYQKNYDKDRKWWLFGLWELLENIKNITNRSVDMVSIDFIDNDIKSEILSSRIQIW